MSATYLLTEEIVVKLTSSNPGYVTVEMSDNFDTVRCVRQDLTKEECITLASALLQAADEMEDEA